MSIKKTRSKPVMIDLFAGCGGLSLGLENAGFYPIFVNELNQFAMETYLTNRQSVNNLLSKKYHSYDIKEMVLSAGYFEDLKKGFKLDYGIDVDLGEVDLVTGGPPCQGFSGIGHRRSYSVEKQQLPSNHLYQDMAYIINQIRPKVFLFENVRGLLNSRWTSKGDKGEIWDDVRNTFQSIPGYSIRSALVYAKDYGVPQNRPRILLIGLREDIAIKINNSPDSVADGFLPSPTNNYPDLVDLLSDLIDPKYSNGGITKTYPKNATNDLQEYLRYDPIKKITHEKGATVSDHVYSKHSPNIINKFLYMLNNNGEIPAAYQTKKFSQRLLPKRWDKRGPTITATSMTDDYVHFAQPRTLTVREWARLQLFPDWYEFKGKRTTGGLRRAGNPRVENFERELPKYTQIGNAVPVRLAEAVGKHLISIIKK